MGDKTGIQWTDATWNPVTGCSKISPGCAHCYAEKVADRFWPTQYPPVSYVTCSGAAGCTHEAGTCQPFTETRPRQFGDVMCHEDRLEQPVRWTRPRMVFVNSMSDLFHEDVPFRFVDRVFATMARTPHHTYQVLTKRPEQMRIYFKGGAEARIRALVGEDTDRVRAIVASSMPWPLPNVWLGISAEASGWYDLRVEHLRAVPAAVRFVSYEPAIRDLELDAHGRLRGIDWVIVGGESGPEARPFWIRWAQAAVAACKAAGVAVFVKQMGTNPVGLYNEQLKLTGKGAEMDEWPADIRVREFPQVR